MEHYDFLEDVIHEYLGDDAAVFLQQYMEEGKRIPFSAYVVPDFLTMKASAAGAPVVGFLAGKEEAFRK